MFLKIFARGSLGVPFLRVFWGGRGRNRFVNFVKSVSIQESGVITCKNVFGWDGKTIVIVFSTLGDCFFVFCLVELGKFVELFSRPKSIAFWI